MASPPLPLRERAGVRGLFVNEIVLIMLTPHPNPLPQGERGQDAPLPQGERGQDIPLTQGEREQRLSHRFTQLKTWLQIFFIFKHGMQMFHRLPHIYEACV
jgi:hypothetical protein